MSTAIGVLGKELHNHETLHIVGKAPCQTMINVSLPNLIALKRGYMRWEVLLISNLRCIGLVENQH